MKLLSTNEVCEMLGVSKATLYRWNNIIDNDISKDHLTSIFLKRSPPTPSSLKNKYSQLIEQNISPTPKNFPRPFKIGRAYKWRSDEIESWLETMRVRDEKK